MRPTIWQSCVLLLATAGAVLALQEFFAKVAYFSDGSAVWWPVNGIALGVLLIARRRHWPWILLGFAVSMAYSEKTEATHTYLLAALCNTLQIWLPALALPRFRSMDRWLAQDGVTSRFITWAVVVASLVSGLLGALYAHGRPGDSYWLTVLRWAAGDALGCALVTPLLLTMASRETLDLFRPAMLARTVGLVGLLTGLSWAIFQQNVVPTAFVLYPLILLVGTQVGMSGAVIAINLMATIATALTLRGKGPFGSQAGGNEGLRVLVLQLFLVLSISMVLPVGVARVRRLTTEAKLARAAREMERLAAVDGLTGVANRRSFDMALKLEWRRAKRQRTALAMMMIDADHFKAFNDNYGHLAGDTCLRAIAMAIASVPGRPGDLVARYGGEEFALLLPFSDCAGADALAERVRKAVSDLAIVHEFNETKCVTVSIGVAAIVPMEGMDPMTLIERSDKALYSAKHNGRNRVHSASGLLTVNA